MRSTAAGTTAMTLGCQCIWAGVASTMGDLTLERRLLYIGVPMALMAAINFYSAWINRPSRIGAAGGRTG